MRLQYKKPDIEPPLKESGKLCLNYANPEHFAYVLQRFGGEELLKGSYPEIYKVMIKTKELHEKTLLEDTNGEISEGIYNGYVFGIIPASFTKTGKSRDNLLKGDADFLVESATDAHAGTGFPYLLTIGQMQNITKSYIMDSFSYSYTDDLRDYMEPLSYPLYDLGNIDDQTIQSFSENHYLNLDGTMGSSMCCDKGLLVEGGVSIVKEFKIEKPYSLTNNPINILYGREASGVEVADYSYSQLSPDKNHLIHVMLPIKATMEFADGFIPKGFSTTSSTQDIILTYSDNGTVKYNYTKEEIASCFTVDKDNPNLLHIEFNENWNNKIDTSSLGTNTELTLHCSFFLEVSQQSTKVMQVIPCSINSTLQAPPDGYYTATGPSVRIPKIKVRWGCFAKDTMITLEDKSVKRIDQIIVGDKLYSYPEGTVVVEEIIKGMEKDIVQIETMEGIVIKLSANHPVMTQEGPVAAKDITTTHQMLKMDGTFIGVKFSYLAPYNDYVLNLYTGSKASFICANALVAGDYQAQCDAKSTPKAAESLYTDEIKNLKLQFHSLATQLFGEK